MKEICKCDKCQCERECTIENFVCIHEGIEKITENEKPKEIETIKYLTEVTVRICGSCLNKRKFRFLLFALLFAVSSLPFFIWGKYLEFGFIFIIVAITVIFLSTGSHEIEYIARLHYKNYREDNNGSIIQPKLIKKILWEELLKNRQSGKFKITDYNR